MRQYRPLPPNLELAPTLARRVNQLRELRNLTVLDLAKMTRFTTRRVEDIEAGLETWLSATDRQKLATALAVEPQIFVDVESRSGKDTAMAQLDVQTQLTQAILQGARRLQCPQCGNELRCSVQDALDLDGNATEFAKAFCVQCPFVLK